MGLVRDRWGHWCELARTAAVVLDRPLRLILDRSWVGGGAATFEQELAGRRQALQTACQRVLEALAAGDAAEPIRPGRADESGAQPWPPYPFLPVQPPLVVPTVATSVTASSLTRCPGGTFTGVDLEGFTDLAARLRQAEPVLLEAVEQIPGGMFAAGPVGQFYPVGEVRRIREIAAWARTAGQDIARRLALVQQGQASGLTGPPGVSGKLVSSASMAGLFQGMVDQDHAPEKFEADLAAVTAYVKGLGENPGPMDPALSKVIAARCDDPAFCARLLTAIGPTGLTTAVRGAQALREHPERWPKEWRTNPDRAAALAQLTQFQTATATNLARMLASASRMPNGLSDEYARELVETDPEAAGILFTYGDRAKARFGGRFMHQAITVMIGRERGRPSCWGDHSLRKGFGDAVDLDGLLDPVREALRAAENSPESAQAVLGDDALLAYLLTDPNTPSHPGRGQAVAELVTEATVNHALDKVPPGVPKEQSVPWQAAKISARVIQTAAGDKALTPDARFAVAKVFAMYLPEIQGNMLTSDFGRDRPVQVLDHTDPLDPWPYGVTAADGWPRFGFAVNASDIRKGLRAVGGDQASRELLGRVTTRYTATLLDRGAARDQQTHTTVHLPDAARDSAALTGLLVSELADGDVIDAKDQEERRAKVAGIFLTALDFTPVGPALKTASPFIGDYIISETKDQITKKAAGKLQQVAVDASNDGFDDARKQLRLQAFEAARAHDLLSADDLKRWPKTETGQPAPLREMTGARDRQRVADGVGRAPGSYSGETAEEIDDGIKAYVALRPQP